MSFRLETTPIGPVPDLGEPTDRPPVDPGLLEAFVGGGAGPAARLLEPGALAVTTGQQPGLFGGPLYAIHKALSAAALARRLEEAWARPVVPVFWVAGDDHDHAEVAWAAWLDEDGQLVRHVLPPRDAADPQLPMYRTRLGEPALAANAALAHSLRGGAHRDEVLAWASRHWHAGATMAGAFAGAMAELLAPHGVAVFEPTHVAAKRLAAPVIGAALEQWRPIEEDLLARTAELRAAGRDPGVPVGDGATLVMLEGASGRDRVLHERGGFVLRRSGERWSAPALRALLAGEPERFSANVLLRPVVERSLLPTVAYLGGPGELRYLPLAGSVHARLGLTPQQPVPRWSGRVLEPQLDRTLAKFGATIAELEAPGEALERLLVRRELPEGVRAAFDRLERSIRTEYGSLAGAAAEIDPTLVRSLEGRRDRALEGVERALARLVGHLKRRRAVELAQIERARTLILPGGQPQERVLGPSSFLARHGPAWMEAVLGAARQHAGGALEGAPPRT